MGEFVEFLRILISYCRPVLEIFILTFLFYKILYYLRGTRGANILAGMVIALMLLTVASDLLKFEVINWILSGLWTLLATAIIVIFQPELRRGFAQLGSSPFQRQSRKKEAITEVVTAALNMSKRKIGALMVLERKIGMRAIVDDAIKLDVKLNSMILESIFYPNSPLHDGAVIIKNDRIIAAHAILPLTRDDDVIKKLGTRHRAAVGISEETDAVVLIVSEETGIISIACRGNIRRDIKADRLLRYLSGLMIASDKHSFADIFDAIQDDENVGFSEGGDTA